MCVHMMYLFFNILNEVKYFPKKKKKKNTTFQHLKPKSSIVRPHFVKLIRCKGVASSIDIINIIHNSIQYLIYNYILINTNKHTKNHYKHIQKHPKKNISHQIDCR